MSEERRETDVQTVTTELLPHEKNELADRAGQLNKQIRVLDETFEQVKKKYKKERGALESPLEDILLTLEKGCHEIEVDVVRHYDYGSGKVIVYRASDDYVLEDREMTEEEAQAAMPLEQPSPKGTRESLSIHSEPETQSPVASEEN